MKIQPKLLVILCTMVALAGAPTPHARADAPTRLTIFAAGTLAVPFKELDALYVKRYPDVVPQPQYGGSVKMAKLITELHEPADVIAVADYSVIPSYLFAGNGHPAYASWYAGFARNAITFVYTPKSAYAKQITAKNWYKILARKGVQIGRSDPDTDPSGYQTVQMLMLAQSYYRVPGLADRVLANAPRTNMRDTETSLISALQIGQIDYLAIYRSDALQHHFKYLDLPAAINLSDPNFAATYAKAVMHNKNGAVAGKPIVYAITIPSNAEHPALAEKYIALLLGPEGQAILRKNGFGGFAPAFAVDMDKMPASLRPLVKPWPAS